MMRQVALGLPRRLTESRTASRYCVSDKPAPTRLALLTFPVARIDEIRALSLSGRTLVPPRTCALHKSPYLLWFAASAASVPPASPLSAAVHAYRVPGARRVTACGWRYILRSCARAVRWITDAPDSPPNNSPCPPGSLVDAVPTVVRWLPPSAPLALCRSPLPSPTDPRSSPAPLPPLPAHCSPSQTRRRPS